MRKLSDSATYFQWLQNVSLIEKQSLNEGNLYAFSAIFWKRQINGHKLM